MFGKSIAINVISKATGENASCFTFLRLLTKNSHQATNSHRSIYETCSLDCFRNAYHLGIPAFFQILAGTAEAVLYPRPIHETSPSRAPDS
jgi:hypothetical protein